MVFKPRHGRFHALKSILQECEETILGYERMPPHRLLGQTHWGPDELSAYCGRCGHSVVNHARECRWDDARVLPCSHVIRLGSYQEPLSSWIREFKFRQWVGMGERLGELLGRRSRDCLGRFEFSMDCVVPVPMPFMRRHARGIDHARVLAKEVATLTQLPIRRVIRQRHGPSLVSGPFVRRHRRPNPFQPSGRGKLTKGKNILLVDDVLTTGSTCRAACRILRSMGCRRIVLAVVAVSE